MAQTYRNYFKGKPSRALQAMVDGLRMTTEERGFRLDVSDYGRRSWDNDLTEYVCYGCCATAAVRAILREPIPPCLIGDRSRRAAAAEAAYDDQAAFESAINDVRCGTMESLFVYMGRRLPGRFSVPGWWIDNGSWPRHLPDIDRYIKRLEKAGL